jgi:hypothetical protein
VRGADGASRNIKCPEFIAKGRQVSQDRLECQIDDSSNVLSKNPSRPLAFDNFKHCRPEMTVIRFAQLLPGV